MILERGANAPMGADSLIIRWERRPSGVDVDVSAFMLAADGRVRGDADMVFYNQPAASGLSMSSDQVRREASFAFDGDAVPAEIARIAICVALDAAGAAHGLPEIGVIEAHVGGTSFRVDLAGASEQALVVVEIYRRVGQWKLRAVGQGFAGGLAPLARSYGMDIEEASRPLPEAATPHSSTTLGVDLRKQRIEARLVDLAKRDPKLVSLAKTAGVSLAKNGSADRAAKAWLILDVSGSMHGLFVRGTVDRLVQRALAYALNIDDDGEINVILFDDQAVLHGTVNPSNYSSFSAAVMRRRDIWGTTDYASAMSLLRREAGRESDFGRMPVYVMFVTDGETNDRKAAERAIRDTSAEGIFWKFMAIGKMPRGLFGGRRRALPSGFDFLAYLDDMPGRVIDNADFFAVSDPDEPTDAEFFDLMANEYGQWIDAALASGVLRR